MGALITLLAITFISLLIVRVGAAALVMTGLSRDVAEFQAISAFFGVGFTTQEAELVVKHPVRRRIIRDLIILGNIGLTSVLATVLITFMGEVEAGGPTRLQKLAVVFVGLLLLFGTFRLRIVRDLADALIRRSLRSVGVLRTFDYDMLLRVHEGYAVARYEVPDGHPLIGHSLAESRLGSRGVVVLAIERASGAYLGAPDAPTRIEAGDTLTIYAHDVAAREALHEPASLLSSAPVPATPGRDGRTTDA
ncbi:MAG: TrkA C-terminal domain-containing protein [Phycisphaerales bacterium]|jgi:hypothetical protein|nr:TrkA C-terminal domain-containing protein [Phycisphaerales bacterium]